jgi:hypothetical protein
MSTTQFSNAELASLLQAALARIDALEADKTSAGWGSSHVSVGKPNPRALVMDLKDTEIMVLSHGSAISALQTQVSALTAQVAALTPAAASAPASASTGASTA